MEYVLTPLPKSEIEIKVALPFSEFEPRVRRAAVLISEEIEIEGFRKGHAPYEVVKNRVGESAIYERAAELAARHTYPELIAQIRDEQSAKKKDFTPIGKPEITLTKLSPGNELCYTVRMTVLPAVNLPDYKSIARKILTTKETQAVSDEEVGAAIRWLRESRTQLITVDRPAQAGDRIEVDFETRAGGVKLAQGDSRRHPIILGQKKFIPGFEDHLIGMKAEEIKSFTLTAPEDWHDKKFAGKALDFTTTMKMVQERRMPELNGEFAKGMGDFATMEALQASVREGLLAEKIDKEKQRIRGLVVAEIAKDAEIELPTILIDAETGKMLEELKAGVAEMGMKWEDYLLHIGRAEENLRLDWREEAERRARIGLCLREIAAKERLQPSEEEIAERTNQTLQQFRTANAESSARYGTGVDPERLREYTKGVLRNEKVFDWLEQF